MLQGFGLSYEPDPRVGPLFENLDLTVAPGERVFLTGRNGTGKTKLCEILSGILPPTSGRVIRQSGTRVAYLPQDLDLRFDGTLDDMLGDSPLLRRLLPRLGIDRSMLAQPYTSLSLGERTRAHLAATLAEEPDILILDEPTNHLDIQGRRWLEETLASCPQGMLIVCHDRATIDALATRVLELERGTLHEYTGGYTDMSAAKALARDRQRQEYTRQHAEAKRVLASAEATLARADAVRAKPRNRDYSPAAKPFYEAKAARVEKRAQAMRQRVDQARSAFVEKPFEEQPTELVFPSRPLRSAVPLLVRDVFVRFERPVLEGVSLTLERGSRHALVGPNGGGKTTLFRVILGELTPDHGRVEWSPDAQVAFLSQGRSMLDPAKTVIDTLAPETPEAHAFVRTLLARLHVRRDVALRPIHELSVGERTKVEIVWMLGSEANVLILDEPTNHLDIPSLEALEDALLAFPGAVLFTSHDREFVERVSTEATML